MPRDWQSLVNTFTDVQRLVHLAMRMDSIDEDRTRVELLKQRRRAYESELTEQAVRIGCPGRTGRLLNGPILSELNEMCKADASSIVNTYNYDLCGAILNIAAETPTANRHVYAKRLLEWDEKRKIWKGPQIAEYTEGSARILAQQHFKQYNGPQGYAELEPRTAVCPVCQGWIARGQVPLKVAMNNPPPYHIGCPHNWLTRYDQVSPEQCPMLWMGE